jgi:hypothetical protein
MHIRLNLSNLRPVRFLVAAFVSTLLFLTNAFPALAISTSPSSLQKGEAPINDIYEKSKDVLKAEPRTQEELQTEANKGINEIQGDADRDQMNTPENSQDAVTAKEQLERVLERVTGKD